ncbi:hypothetical protein ACFL1R_05975 [Candidatus Latescibacterota bacterium]
MDEKDMRINYENQVFDELDANSYEIVIAISKMARELNNKSLKYLGPDTTIKPINLAIKETEGDKIEFVYEDEKSNYSSEEPTPEKNESE